MNSQPQPTQQEIDSRLTKEGIKLSVLSEAERLEFYNFIVRIASKYVRR